MTQVTVKELAQVVDTPVERLLQQMREAGLPHTSAEQVVTDNEKQALLAHLKSSHGEKLEEPRKITLQRKTTTTLKVAGSKTISVEVRKKKTYVKRSPDEIEAEKQRELEEQRAAEEAARLKAEEEARKQAEAEARKQQDAAALAAVAPAAEVAAAAPAAEPVSAAVAAERKKEELRRAEKDKPVRSDDDERRDRKHAQHRPAPKDKAPTPRVAPRSTDEEVDDFRRGRGGRMKPKKRNQHGFQSPTGPIVREVAIGDDHAAATQELVDVLGEPHPDPLHPAGQRGLVIGLAHEVDVIVLHREVHEASAEALTALAERAEDHAHQAFAADAADLARQSQREVLAVGRFDRRAGSVRDVGARRPSLAAGSLALTAVGLELELQLLLVVVRSFHDSVQSIDLPLHLAVGQHPDRRCRQRCKPQLG